MTNNMGDGMALQNGRTQARQRFILTVFKNISCDTFKFDANGVVVAIAASPITGDAGMPGAVIAAYELPEFTSATDVKMRRHDRTLDTFKVGMLVPVELIGKQALHLVTPKLARWQTDAVQHNQINLDRWRARTVIGGRQSTCKLVPAIGPKWLVCQWLRWIHQKIRRCAGCLY